MTDDNGDKHIFLFETFSNNYDVLTMVTYVKPHEVMVAKSAPSNDFSF